MTGLTKGQDYKVQASSVNEVDESELSPAAMLLFANRPDAPASLTLTSTRKPSIEAHWTAPTASNGDEVAGYKLYIDNGVGGDFVVVFDGSSDQPATYSHVIEQDIECGALYNLMVTAINVAGESDGKSTNIEVGEPPSYPLEPRMTSITPGATVTIKWDHSHDDGCLPVRYY